MQRSAASLLEWHPEAKVECFTTDEDAALITDDRIAVTVMRGALPAPGSWHDQRLKLRAIQIAWHAAAPLLYLDNDTFVLGSLSEPWAMLDRFDVLACAAPITDQRIAKNMRPLRDEFIVPAAFGEVNGGVLFLASRAATGRLIDRWVELLAVHPDEPGDQWRLRIALWELAPRLHLLPNNFNYRLPMRQPVFGPIRILHGHADDPVAIAHNLNAYEGYRFVDKITGGYAVRR
jgi:hypothetical protein